MAIYVAFIKGERHKEKNTKMQFKVNCSNDTNESFSSDAQEDRISNDFVIRDYLQLVRSQNQMYYTFEFFLDEDNLKLNKKISILQKKIKI